MIELRIDNMYKALELIDSGWPTHIISLMVPDDDRVMPSADTHLMLRCHDTELVDDPMPGIVIPSKEQIAEALALSGSLTDGSRLLVHCYAGKSRSTPVAMGALIQHGMSVDEALEEVLKQRPTMIPNRLIVRYVDEILELNGALVEACRAYYKKLDEEGKLPLALLKRHNIDGEF